MEGEHLPRFSTTGEGNIAAADAFALTSRWQISRDLVKEWITCNRPPLSSHSQFDSFMEMDGYFGPTLDVVRPESFFE